MRQGGEEHNKNCGVHEHDDHHGLGYDDDGHGLDDNDAGQLLGQGKDDALKEVGMVAKETSRLPTLRIIKMD